MQPRIKQAVDARTVRLKGNVHPLARPEFDRGSLPDSQPVDRMLLLLQRSVEQESALRQLLDEQQTQGSPRYHAWLTPQEFGQQFGPADADIQVVKDWLASQGFQGINVSQGKIAVEFTGTAGQVRNAFHTEIHKFLVNGEERNANAGDPQIPAALAPVVAGVVSLHNFPRKSYVRRLGTFQRDKATGGVRPLFTYPPDPTKPNSFLLAVGPTDFATIYNVLPLWQAGIDGTGQTIAVVGDSNINLADVQDFRTMFGLPPNTPQVIIVGPDPGAGAGEGEADLDVQWAGAIAKNAQIILVIAEDPFTAGVTGADLSALYVVDNNLASVMSESFGDCEANLGTTSNQFENALWQQAASQGITAMVATGDEGSAGCDNPNTELVAIGGLAVNGIASTPFNVAVGGTDFDNSLTNYVATYWNQTNGTGQSSAKSYIPEVTWNDTCAATGSTTACTATVINNDAAKNPGIDLVAGSGGVSAVYAKPSWQTGNGVPSDGKRDLPDISLFASNGQNSSFYIFCQMDANPPPGTTSCDLNSPFQDFQGAGGTSFASPIFAGIIALVNQYQASHGGSSRQGNVNYVLYPMAARANATCTSNPSAVGTAGCIFYDLPAGAGNISVACKGGTPNCSNTSTAANQYGIITTSTGGSSPAYNTTAGYDLATGLGSVNAGNLVTNWAAGSFRASNTTFTLNGGAPVTTTHGTAISVSGTVAPQSGSGTPTGIVELMQGTAFPGTVLDTFTLTGGAYSGMTRMLPGTTAPYQVFAHYGGDGTFAASDSATQTVSSVAKENSLVTVSFVTFTTSGAPNPPTTTPGPVQYGSPYILRVDVTNASNQPCSTSVTPIPCPTGAVTMLDNGAPLNDFLPNTNTAQLNNGGFLEDQPIQLPGGSHHITASYGGDNSYNAQPSSNNLAVTITPATTTTAVTANPSTNVTTTTPVALTAAITSSSNSATGATGTVTFLDGGTQIGSPVAVVSVAATATASAGGTASLTQTFSTAGTHSITAHYTGDQNYAASTSSATQLTVTQGGGFTVGGSVATAPAGNSGTSTITLTPSGGFTGQVAVSCPAASLPPGVTCSPLTITVSGSGAATGQLTVNVAAPSAPGTTAQMRSASTTEYAGFQASGGRGWWKLSAATGLAAMVLFFLPGRRRYRGMLALWMICLLSLAIGCGGSSGGVVARAATTTRITAPQTKAAQGTAMTFNIAVTSTGATPAGMVQLFDGTTALGSAVAVANGAASINTSALTVGTHQVSAHYLGDASTLPSQSGSVSVTATGTTTVGIATNPASSNSNASFSLTIN